MKLIAKEIKKKGCDQFGSIHDLVEGSRASNSLDGCKAKGLSAVGARFY